MVLTLLASGAASAYLTRHGIAAANTSIQAELGWNDAQMGRILGAFAIGYTLFQVPGGWLGNRLGSRWAFSALSVLWSLANAVTALGTHISLLWTSRLALGVFQAGMVPISAQIVKDWIPNRHRGISSACIGASMSIGGALTMALTGWLLAGGHSWRAILGAYSVVGIVWAAVFCAIFRTQPGEHPGVNESERRLIEQPEPRSVRATAPQTVSGEPTSQAQPGERSGGEGFDAAQTKGGEEGPGASVAWRLLCSSAVWGLCIQAFFRNAGYTFFVTWFFAFLEYGYGIDKESAGLLNSLPLIAVVIGSLLGGVAIDFVWRWTGSRWWSRSGLAITALSICGLFTMAAAWTATATQLAFLIAVGALFSGMGNPAAWSATIDVGGRQTAVVMGVMNTAGSLAAVVLPMVLGSWFDQIRASSGSWEPVIYLHAAFYFLGALSWLIINPNRALAP